MKKGTKYTIISLLLLLGLLCVGVLYLFFIPNSNLFGVAYVNNNEKLKSKEYSTKDIVTDVVLNSSAYEINVLPSDNNKYSVEVYSNSFGFVLEKNKDCSINSNLRNGILTFNVTETHGFASKNNSYINLYLPAGDPTNVKINNKKAKTTINSELVTIEKLTYSTKSGNFFFNSGRITGLIDLSLQRAEFNISEAVKTEKNPVNLKMTSGRFNAPKSKLGDIEIKENKNGIIKIQECGTLQENVASAGGQIYIEKMSHLELSSSDTIVEVGEITNGAVVTLTKSGSLSINKLQGGASVITSSGNIFVNSCSSSSSFHSDSGNITINNAQNIITIKSRTGKATVNFSETAGLEKNTLYASIVDGSLYATGVEHVGKISNTSTHDINGISITGKGNATIKMRNVFGENSINANNGSVKIVIDSNANYILNTSSNSGSVRVNLLQITNSGGYTDLNKTTPINCSTSDNYLSVSSNKGSITVLDSVIDSYGF